MTGSPTHRFPGWLLLFALFFGSSVARCDTGTSPKVTIANGEWPPFMSENVPHYGLASHIVTRAFELQGIAIEYVFLPWKRALTETRMGKYDATIGWLKTPEREQQFLISEPIFFDRSGVFHLKQSKRDWTTSAAYKGARVAKILGYEYSLFKELGIEPYIIYEPVRTDDVGFRMLLEGRIDIMPSSSIDVGLAIMNQIFKKSDIEKIAFTVEPNNKPRAHHLLFDKHKNHLLKKFNLGFRQLQKSGEYQSMIDAARTGAYLK